MGPSRKDQSTKALVKDFLEEDGGSIRPILQELIFRTVERKIDVNDFLEIIKEKRFTWGSFVDLYKDFDRYKRASILFYFLTEIRKKFPWAITQKEFFEDIYLNKGKLLGIKRNNVSKVFQFLRGGTTWGRVIRALLGERYLPVGRSKKQIIITSKIGPIEIPIYWDIKEFLLRVLLMGNDVNAPAIDSILQIYDKKPVRMDVFSPVVKSSWFELKNGVVIDLHPKLREAVELFQDQTIQQQWKMSIKKGKVKFYFKKRN